MTVVVWPRQVKVGGEAGSGIVISVRKHSGDLNLQSITRFRSGGGKRHKAI